MVSFALLCTLLFTRLLRIIITTQSCKIGSPVNVYRHGSVYTMVSYVGVSQGLVWCFPRFYLIWCLAANRLPLLQQPLYSVNPYRWYYFTRLISEGNYIVCDGKPNFINPLGAIPKSTRGIRLIHDCSRPSGNYTSGHKRTGLAISKRVEGASLKDYATLEFSQDCKYIICVLPAMSIRCFEYTTEIHRSVHLGRRRT